QQLSRQRAHGCGPVKTQKFCAFRFKIALTMPGTTKCVALCCVDWPRDEPKPAPARSPSAFAGWHQKRERLESSDCGRDRVEANDARERAHFALLVLAQREQQRECRGLEVLDFLAVG